MSRCNRYFQKKLNNSKYFISYSIKHWHNNEQKWKYDDLYFCLMKYITILTLLSLNIFSCYIQDKCYLLVMDIHLELQFVTNGLSKSYCSISLTFWVYHSVYTTDRFNIPWQTLNNKFCGYYFSGCLSLGFPSNHIITHVCQYNHILIYYFLNKLIIIYQYSLRLSRNLIFMKCLAW